MKAVLDRFENDYAVLLVGEEEIKVNVHRTLLPPGAGEGSVLDLSLELDPEVEKDQRQCVKNRLNKLKDSSREVDH